MTETNQSAEAPPNGDIKTITTRLEREFWLRVVIFSKTNRITIQEMVIDGLERVLLDGERSTKVA